MIFEPPHGVPESRNTSGQVCKSASLSSALGRTTPTHASVPTTARTDSGSLGQGTDSQAYGLRRTIHANPPPEAFSSLPGSRAAKRLTSSNVGTLVLLSEYSHALEACCRSYRELATRLPAVLGGAARDRDSLVQPPWRHRTDLSRSFRGTAARPAEHAQLLPSEQGCVSGSEPQTSHGTAGRDCYLPASPRRPPGIGKQSDFTVPWHPRNA